MTLNDDFVPNVLGEIDDGPFGKVPLYMASLHSEIYNIYQWRQENNLSESDDGTDEFFFLAATDSFGTCGEVISYTSNSVAKKAELFNAPKVNSEPFVLFKAYFHLVGTFIEPVTSSELGVKSVLEASEEAAFTLPKIPYEMVAEMDAFFRAVDKKFGTEGIVLLTYDFNYLGAANEDLGWNFGVPDQKNTGAHCDYDKANVIDSLSDKTRIVGTVHSHPHMRAYASPTDHNDQAGFDGLHITFGWSIQTKGLTEYHAEMVRGGNFTWIAPEDVMDLENEYVYQFDNEVTLKKGVVQIPTSKVSKVKRDVPIAEVKIDELMLNVTKAYASTTTTTHSNNHYSGSTGGGSGKVSSPTKGQQSFIDQNTYLPGRNIHFSEPVNLQNFSFAGENFNIPDATKNNVLIRLQDDEKELDHCPLCDMVWNNSNQELFGEIVRRRQCVGCGVFVLLDDETLTLMDETRRYNGYYPLENFYQYDLPTVIWDFRNYLEDKDWTPSYEVIEASDTKKVYA
jgi:hypothetical protein